MRPRETIHQELIRRIADGMTNKGLDQMKLASASGVPQGNISRILRGQRPGTSLRIWDKLLRVTESRGPGVR